MRQPRFIWILVAVAAVSAVLLVGIVTITRIKTLTFVRPGGTVVIWGNYISSADNRLTITLTPSPDGATAALAGAGRSATITVSVPAGLPMTADYYVGDVTSGTLVKTDPLNLQYLYPGALLRLEVRSAGNGQWAAVSVSRRQSISPPNGLPPPPVDAKILPRVRPP